MNCKICQAEAPPFSESTILGKYSAQYFRCSVCGFIFIADPLWLQEAYSHALARLDVGVMQRNIMNVDITCAVTALVLPKSKMYLDFGGGHGTFVRMMRDRGFDFYWRDAFAENIHARGFEHREDCRYDLVTAFEVLEHLPDPLIDIAAMMGVADNVLVSTLIVPEPPPQPGEWWYYTLSTGQHISFFTPKSLQAIARKFGRTLVSNGWLHLFSTNTVSDLAFRMATKPRLAKVLRTLLRRRSLTDADFQKFSG